MNRKVFVVSLLALGGLVTAAEVRSTQAEQQRKLRDFQAKAQEARKAQKLDGNREALVAKYPTPEIKLLQPVEAQAGSELTLTASGRFVPGSLVLVPCEGVEVLSTKVTAERAEARVRIRPTATRTRCDLQIVSPVSAISRSRPALSVRNDAVWELKLANGLTTRWRVERVEGGSGLTGDSEWFQNGKSLGTRPVLITLSGDKAFAMVGSTKEEVQAAEKAAAASSADIGDIAKAMEAAIKRMEAECGKLPSEQQEECGARYQAEFEAINQRFAEGQQQAEVTMESLATVCRELNLKTAGGKVTGTADKCPKGDGVRVSGTWKAATAK